MSLGHSPKLHKQGPFKVMKKVNNVLYKVQVVSSSHWRLIMHFDRLKPYQQRTFKMKASLKNLIITHQFHMITKTPNQKISMTHMMASYIVETQSDDQPTNASPPWWSCWIWYPLDWLCICMRACTTFRGGVMLQITSSDYSNSDLLIKTLVLHRHITD